MRQLLVFLIILTFLCGPAVQAAPKRKKTLNAPEQTLPPVDPVLKASILIPDCSVKKKDKILKEICLSLAETQKEEDELNRLIEASIEGEALEKSGKKKAKKDKAAKEDVEEIVEEEVVVSSKEGIEPQVRIKLGRRIMTIPMEDYLAGVIGNEMNSRWPKEALKAQAVAARSYAIYGMLIAQKNGRSFDLHTTQADQVFRVRESKNEYLRGLVAETRGQVLTKRGKVVQAFYSSTCGGSTRSAVDAGLNKKSPLTKGCRDKYCEISPFRDWYVQLSLTDIEKKLNASGINVKNLKSVKVKNKDKAGYAMMIDLLDDNGHQLVKAWTFRSAIGYMRIKSVLFNISSSGGDVHIHGHGFGHGVGLCQFGAKAMALKNRNYKTILKKYYPKTMVTRWY